MNDNEPGYNGQREIGFKDVEDPYEPDALLAVAVNIRHDVIEHLYSRINPNTGERAINEAQRRAGNLFLAILERSEAIHGLVIDYARDRVDGGQRVSPIPL